MTTRPFLTPRNMAIASSWLRPCRLRLLTATISSPGKGIMIALVPAHYVGPPGQVGNARNQESRPPPLICIYAHGKTFHCRANDGFCLPPDFAYSSLAKLVSIAFRPVTPVPQHRFFSLHVRVIISCICTGRVPSACWHQHDPKGRMAMEWRR